MIKKRKREETLKPTKRRKITFLSKKRIKKKYLHRYGLKPEKRIIKESKILRDSDLEDSEKEENTIEASKVLFHTNEEIEEIGRKRNKKHKNKKKSIELPSSSSEDSSESDSQEIEDFIVADNDLNKLKEKISTSQPENYLHLTKDKISSSQSSSSDLDNEVSDILKTRRLKEKLHERRKRRKRKVIADTIEGIEFDEESGDDDEIEITSPYKSLKTNKRKKSKGITNERRLSTEKSKKKKFKFNLVLKTNKKKKIKPKINQKESTTKRKEDFKEPKQLKQFSQSLAFLDSKEDDDLFNSSLI